MRWKRVVIGAALGGLLGFGGQFVADFFLWDNSEPSIQQPITPYKVIFDRDPESESALPPARAKELRSIYLQIILWVWLLRRGEMASHTALIVAFLAASAALAFDRQKSSKSTAKPNVAANHVAEPKVEAGDPEPRKEPAQIETAEQAAVLKTAPKKERTEA